MSKIEFYKIGNFIAGQSPESKFYTSNSTKGIPFLQGNRSFGVLYPTIDTYTEKVTKLANEGDILMSVRAPVGDLNYAPCQLCIGRGLSTITAKNGNNEFLFYALKYNIQNLIRQGNGTTYDAVNKDIVNNMLLIIPENEKDQKKISNLLSSIDSKIALNNKINDTLQQQAKLLYDYWFNQFEFPNEEGKPYKSSGGKMVWNDELKREIPEGWHVKKLKDCVEHINTGLNPRKNFILNEGGNVKYVTVKNLTANGTIDFSGCDKITKEVKELINKRSMIKKGDILFASIAPLGRCYLMYETPEDWEINESVFAIRPDYEIVNSEYLYMFFMSDWFIKKSEHSSTGSIFNGIRISTLEDTYLVVPTKSILDAFKTMAEPLYKSKFNSVKESQELESLRDFLLPMLMNGQATVED